MEMVTYRAYVPKSKFYSVRSLINTHSFHVDLTLITDNVNMRYVSKNTEQLVDMRIFVIVFSWGVGYQGTKLGVLNPKQASSPLCTSFHIEFHLEQECTTKMLGKMLYKNGHVGKQKHLTLYVQDMLVSEWESFS